MGVIASSFVIMKLNYALQTDLYSFLHLSCSIC